MRRSAFLVVVLALLMAACGGEVETETFASTPAEPTVSDPGADLADALTASVLANPDRRFDDEAASCIGQGIVDEFGVDGLAALGVDPDNPNLEGGRVLATPEAARRAVDIGMECIDLQAALLSFVPADVSLLDETVECVANELQSDVFRDLFADVVVVGDSPADILDEAAAQLPIASLLLACLSPEEILQLDDLLN